MLTDRHTCMEQVERGSEGGNGDKTSDKTSDYKSDQKAIKQTELFSINTE